MAEEGALDFWKFQLEDGRTIFESDDANATTVPVLRASQRTLGMHISFHMLLLGLTCTCRRAANEEIRSIGEIHRKGN